jgi:PPOX class probable F420-dependent enzyme
MEEREALDRFSAARVARMATVDAAGRPHVVPVVFAVEGATAYWAVDHKPKRSPHLKRLRNIERTPYVQLVVDHYEESWDRLWWVRASGAARIVTEPSERHRAVALLAAKYPQYSERAPQGAVVATTLHQVTGWSASEHA